MSAVDIEAVDERCRALAALAAQPGDAAASTLLAALDDPSWRVRGAAARALGERPPGVEAIGERLAGAALEDPHLWVRQAAGAALAGSSSSGLARLRAALRDPSIELRERALRALARWREPEASSALVEALADPVWRVRAAAAEALGDWARWESPPTPRPDRPAPRQTVIDALAAVALGDVDAAVRAAATFAIADAGAVDGDTAFSALRSLAEAPEVEIAVAALDALARSRRADRGPRLLPVLRRLARADSDSVRVAALRVLATLGDEAAPALDDIIAAADHRSWTVREEAIEVFADLGSHAPELLEDRLATLARSPAPGARYLAFRVLHRQGSVPGSITPALFEASVLDADPRSRDLASDLLGRTPHAVPLDTVAALLRHRSPAVRRRAAEVVARLGPSAISLLPALDGILPDPSRRVRRAAVQAVQGFGTLGSSRTPLVMRRAFEAEPQVVAAARLALRAIEAPLPERLRTLLGMIGMSYGPEALLLEAIEDALPAALSAEVGRVAGARVGWLDGLGAGGGGAALGAPAGLKQAVLAALAAAERAAARRGKGVAEGEVNRRARDREAAWLLAFVVRARMMGAP